jgi:hypothetical protein
MAIFQPLDPRDENRYAATQVYFVSLDCWEGLKKQFASTLIVAERDVVAGRFREGAYELVAIKAKSRPRAPRKTACRTS